jgi:DNA-binding MarR family transcriptional regulator
MQSAGADDEAAGVLDSLRRIVRALRMTAHSVQHELGISGAQLFVLRELAQEPGISIRRLSERTLTDPSSVSVVAARLVEHGFVARHQDPRDARRGVLSLTPRGERLLKRAREPFQARFVRELRGLPRSSLRRLNADLAAVVRQAGVADSAAPMFFDEAPKRRTHRES